MLPLNRNPRPQPVFAGRGRQEGAIMADDKVEPREINWRQLLPWTAIFQGFRVALDVNKLLLAALGILVMAFVWWILAAVFYKAIGDKPVWPSGYIAKSDNVKEAFTRFKADRQAW